MVSVSVDKERVTLCACQDLPVIANHATGKRSNTSTRPDTPIVDGPGRRPVFDDCEETHAVDLCVSTRSSCGMQESCEGRFETLAGPRALFEDCVAPDPTSTPRGTH